MMSTFVDNNVFFLCLNIYLILKMEKENGSMKSWSDFSINIVYLVLVLQLITASAWLGRFDLLGR